MNHAMHAAARKLCTSNPSTRDTQRAVLQAGRGVPAQAPRGELILPNYQGNYQEPRGVLR
eukprot:571609-Prorocentrum_minimum.AAC.2